MSDQGPVRNSQRTVLACTACARRKVRCSKTIPCTACVRSNKAESCQREQVAVVTRRAAARRFSRQRESSSQLHSSPGSPQADGSEQTPPFTSTASPIAGPATHTPVTVGPLAFAENAEQTPPFTSTEGPVVGPATLHPVSAESVEFAPSSGSLGTSHALPEVTNQMLMQLLTSIPTPETRLTNEATAALEFLAHGRRNVLNRFVGQKSVGLANPQTPIVDANSVEQWDIYLPLEDARMLLALHQVHLTWMHNVVHLPTFRQEFDDNVSRNECDASWVALYYALLSQTLYHIDGDYLASLPQPIASNLETSRALFDKSIEILFRSGFMDKHKLTSVQAICLLLQVAHNFDKSDLICILISSAIRISQCLNLHRLGEDRGLGPNVGADGGMQYLIDREMQKRIWWFLVRYDWLQIPFQNTCQIHPVQFNTPMPANCYDDAQRMIKDGAVVSQPDDVCTSSSWTNSLNQVSVLIWKHQDRMYKVGYPGDDPDKISKLYDEVIWADREIKNLYSSWPLQLRELDEQQNEQLRIDPFPASLMPAMVLICTAHKILSVHRHFQLSGFRDRRFAFSQLSCVTIAERSMEAIQRWPDNLNTRISRRMWTTLTHVISCCITLVFALLFKTQNTLTHDLVRIRRYVEFGKQFISQEERSSSIARRGVRLLSALMNLEQCSEYSVDLEADIGDMVRRFAVVEEGADANAAEAYQVVFPYLDGVWESFIGDSFAGDYLGG